MFNITSGKLKKAQKVALYGPEGIGKSTFASQFPNPIFIDTEGSTTHLDVNRFDKPRDWNILLKMVDYIRKDNQGFKTLVIDTADWAEALAIKHICITKNANSIEDFGYGKGYTYLTEEFSRLLSLLNQVVESGVNVLILAHAQMRKFEQPDEMGAYDRWELKLQKRTSPLLKEWADAVLFANYKTTVVTDSNTKSKKATGGRRVMYTSHHPAWDAKNRWNLPEELELGVKEILPHLLQDNRDLISDAQRKRMFALAGSNDRIVRGIIEDFGYTSTKDIERKDYEEICKDIEVLAAAETKREETKTDKSDKQGFTEMTDIDYDELVKNYESLDDEVEVVEE